MIYVRNHSRVVEVKRICTFDDPKNSFDVYIDKIQKIQSN